MLCSKLRHTVFGKNAAILRHLTVRNVGHGRHHEAQQQACSFHACVLMTSPNDVSFALLLFIGHHLGCVERLLRPFINPWIQKFNSRNITLTFKG
jgi:hypothetical protein